MASDMVLYWGSGSGPCWTVMIMLEEKGLKGYESHQISFSEKGHKGEDIMKLNPRGQVPTFKHGDIIVNESIAIIDYLQVLYGSTGPQLLPTEAALQAPVLQRKYEVINLRKKAMEDYLYQIWQGKTKDMSEEELKKRKDAIAEEVGRWEGYLAKIGDGAYIAGKEFTVADLVFFPVVAFMVRLGFKLAPRFPCLQAYHELVSERESVKASWPPHWKDSPAGTQFADL